MASAIRPHDPAGGRSAEGGKDARYRNSGVDPLDVSQPFDLKVNCRLIFVCIENLEETRALSDIDTHILVPLTLEECQTTLESVLLDKNLGNLLEGKARSVTPEKPHLDRAP